MEHRARNMQHGACSLLPIYFLNDSSIWAAELVPICVHIHCANSAYGANTIEGGKAHPTLLGNSFRWQVATWGAARSLRESLVGNCTNVGAVDISFWLGRELWPGLQVVDFIRKHCQHKIKHNKIKNVNRPKNTFFIVKEKNGKDRHALIWSETHYTIMVSRFQYWRMKWIHDNIWCHGFCVVKERERREKRRTYCFPVLLRIVYYGFYYAALR